MNNQTDSTFPNETPQLLTQENKDVFITFLQNHIIGKTCSYTNGIGGGIHNFGMAEITTIEESEECKCIFVTAKELNRSIATFHISYDADEKGFRCEGYVFLKNTNRGQLLIGTEELIHLSPRPSFGKHVYQIFIQQS